MITTQKRVHVGQVHMIMKVYRGAPAGVADHTLAQRGRSSNTWEINVLNWAKAWYRAKTPKSRAHAKRMLRISVDALQSAEKRGLL